ncbi:hypothetical protein RB653_009318 [Dictyostelium firmibasis]|uniref:Uncharacterized protein n=1 Tax=Dictyostelium firmibasis TaxID=79012 RepID=A0AAN7UE36_9MYCE
MNIYNSNSYLKLNIGDEKNEILFWKVIRNVVLFKRIISFLGVHFRFGYYRYDEIKSVKWMIKRKYYSLLKEKIEKGEEGLSFFQFSDQCTRGSKAIVHSVFNVDEPLKSDRVFYRLLFKNYYNYFINELLLNLYEYNNMEVFSEKKLTKKEKEIQSSQQKQLFIDRLIDYDNHVALSIIVEDYCLHKPNDDDFIYSINVESFNVSLYLISTNKVKIDKSNFEKIWKSILFHINDDIIEHNNNNKNKYNSKIIFSNIDKKIDFLINTLNIQPPSIKLLKSIEDYKINYSVVDSKLNDLLNSCFTISYVNFSKNHWFKIKKEILSTKKKPLPYTPSDCLIPDKSLNEYLNEDYFSLSIEQLQDYKKKFKQLNLLEKLVGNIDIGLIDTSINEMISNLFKMIIPFLTTKTFQNYLYYFIMFKTDDKISGNMIISNKEYQYSKYLVTERERSFIFSNSYINKDRKIKILFGILNDFKNQSKKSDSYQIDLSLNSIWKDLILYDVAKELMELLYSTFIEFNLTPPKGSYPKSPQMLDFLISIKYFDVLNFSDIFDNVQLISYFKSKYPLEYEKSFSKFDIGYRVFNDDVVDYVIENINDFREKLKIYYIDHSINIDSYNNYHSNQFNPNDTNNVIKDFNQIDENERNKCFRILNDPLKLNFFLKEGRLNNLILFNYYENGCVIDLSKELNEHATFNDVCYRSDLKSIEIILSTNNSQRAKWILYYASLHGSLEIFKYIHNNPNHHWVFKDDLILPKEVFHSYIFTFLSDIVKISCSSLFFNKSFI